MTERGTFDRVDSATYWVRRAEEFEDAGLPTLGHACHQIAELVSGRQ